MGVENPLVSSVIAVKNGERFLRQAIDSIIAQTYRPIEIIVVDGRSEDGTEAIARSYEEVSFIRQTGSGVADGWNCGIDADRGEFLAFLSHDDMWTPDKLEVQVGHMLENPSLQYTIARMEFSLEPGHEPPPGFRQELLKGDHVGRVMETLVARKSAFEIIGKLDTSFDTAEDVDWYARAKDLALPMAVIEKVLLQKRVHDANLSLNAPDNNESILRALRGSVRRQRARVGKNTKFQIQ